MGEEEDLYRVLKLFALAVVAIMNFFYPWQRCKKQPGMKLEDDSGNLFFFTASFNSLQTLVHPCNPYCSSLSKSNHPRSPHPRTRKVHKYTRTPRGRSSFYLLISRPEGSAVSSYIDIFMEAGGLSFIKIRAVILSVTCSHDTGVQHDMYHQEDYQ